MKRTCRLVINGRLVEARAGESLIDAALGGSILIPYDCRSGQCQSCRVTVVSGSVDDCGTGDGRTVLACQATVAGDAEIEFEELPLPMKRAGVITEINELSPEIAEVVLTTSAPLEFRPGQYVRVKFSGFPARELSPTFRLDGSFKQLELVFHIRRIPDGTVSGQLGKAIGPAMRRMCKARSGKPICDRVRGRWCCSPEAQAGRRSGRSPARRARPNVIANCWSSPAAAMPITSICFPRCSGCSTTVSATSLRRRRSERPSRSGPGAHRTTCPCSGRKIRSTSPARLVSSIS